MRQRSSRSRGRISKLVVVSIALMGGVGAVAFLLNSRLEEARRQLAVRQQQIVTLELEKRELDGRLQALQAERKQLEERVSVLRGQLAAASADVDQFRANLTELQASYDRLSAERTQLQTQVDAVTSERDERQTHVQRLERENANLTRSMRRLRGRLTLVDRDYQRLAERLVKVTSDSESAGAEGSTAGSGANSGEVPTVTVTTPNVPPPPPTSETLSSEPSQSDPATQPSALSPQRTEIQATTQAAAGSTDAPAGVVELPPIIVRKHPAGSARGATDEAMLAIGQPSGVARPVIRGRLLDVNDVHHFAVVDQGSAHGVQVGMVFEILRGERPVGLATAIRVRPQLSACDLLTAEPNESIQPGDQVVQRGDGPRGETSE